jgi:Tfp pilus assembly protein PilO
MTTRDLLARVMVEHRRVLVPLGIVALINVGLYGLLVYPLSLKVEASERRAAAARAQLAAADADDRNTRATVARAEQASGDLQKFYRELLPSGVESARRMTYAKLANLADEHGLTIARRTYDPDDTYKGHLRKLSIRMSLTGEYRDIRQFLHALETSPEFIVIEDVSVAEGSEPGAPLAVSVRLATYFAGAADGA